MLRVREGRLQVEAFFYFSQLAATVVGVIAILWMARRGTLPSYPMPIWKAAFLATGIAAFAFLSFKASTPPDRFHDFFTAYYPAGQAVANHDPSMLRMLTEKGVAGFVNIPAVAYLFEPLALLGPETAALVFSVVGLALTVAAWFLLVRMANLELRESWLLALLFLANGPLMHGIKFGNTSEFILFALVADLFLLRQGRSAAAGALMGAAAIIKPPLLLFGFFFVLRRDLRGVLAFAAVCAITGGLSLVLFGWSANAHWFQTSIVEYSRGWLGAYNVQSIPGFLLRLHPDSNLTDWQPYLPTPNEKLLARALLGIVLVVAGLACLRHPGGAEARLKFTDTDRQDLQFLLAICLCLTASPLTWSHYYTWLLIPIAFFLGSRPPFPASKVARIIAWAAVALTTPLVEWPWSISNPTLMTAYRSLAISHLLLGGLLWFGLVAWWLARSGGLLSASEPAEKRGFENLDQARLRL